MLNINDMDGKNQYSNSKSYMSGYSSPKSNLAVDFTFNTIKNIKKVNWDGKAPWYREISDGLCWLCYCKNASCEAYN